MKLRHLIRFGRGALIVLAALLAAGWFAFVPSSDPAGLRRPPRLS